jgi:hypothetical protein
MPGFFSLLPNATEAKLHTVYPAILMIDLPSTFNSVYGFDFDFIEQTGEFFEDDFGRDEKEQNVVCFMMPEVMQD